MLFVSHKIAGPLFRFKQVVKELASGNFTNQVRLRKGDQLQDFADEFNEMLAAVRERIRTVDHYAAAVHHDIDGIGEFNVDEQKRRQYSDLKHKIAELEKALKFFRT